MLVTVTPNTTLDLSILVDGFKKTSTMRAVGSFYSMGGKPTDASFILGVFDVPSLALGFAAGDAGKRVEQMLEARGIQTDFTPVDGETRLSLVISDLADRTSTTITTSTLEVQPHHIDSLMSRYAQALEQATCIVTGGTLPKGVPSTIYTDLIRMARQRNIPVIFDASEPNLSAGLKSGPTFIKPNRHELAGLVGYPIDSVGIAYRAGQEVLAQYHTNVVITLDAEGALAILTEPKRIYYVPPIQIEPVNSAGAGDAVLAGIAWSILSQRPIEDGLRLGIAAATAVVIMPGTADCRREDVERFLPQVELRPYPDV
ncbi:MAG: 1-phosphofructokinase family hexose kinase [Anaerolineae bacterium]|nr:1-phosphofructokinase family hexose kinase [Anaerolineae bacterium]